jgi:SAM-dependent methyltransferase
MKYQPYRDEPFQRSCEDRYEIIKKFAKQYNRQFSVLDVGANYGWFGQRLVRDFDCVYVGIDNKTIDPHPRIWHINRHITTGELCCLSRCESFDLVLGLAVLHHMKDYAAAFNAMRRLGHHSLFEICGPGDVNARGYERHEGIAKLFGNVEPVATFESHVSDADRLWYGHSMPPFISEQTLDAAARGCCGYAHYKINADFDECNILIDRKPIKMDDEIRPFIPGMNLHNFRLLGGKVDVPEDDGLADYQPWNFIIGDGIHRIDTFHAKARK